MSYNLGGSGSSSTATIRAKVIGAAQAAAEMRRVAEATETVNVQTRRSVGEVRQAARGWSTWGNAVQWIKTGAVVGAVYGLYNAIKQTVTATITAGLSFNALKENSQIAFTTLLGSADKARKLITELFDLAAHTPFTFVNVQQAATQLLAMGFAAGNIIPMLKTISNLVAANPVLGADAVPRLALVLGQIRSAGRLLGQDALQLFSFGIDPYAILSKTLGKTRQQVRQLGEEGKLNGQQTVDAILAYADRRFKGLAAAQSHTWSGLLSTLSDLSQQFAGALLAPAMPALERNFERLNAALADPKVLATLRRYERDVYNVVRALDPFWLGLERIAVAVGRELLPALRDFGRVAGPVVVEVLDAFGAALSFVADHQELVRLSLAPLISGLKIATTAFSAAQDIIDATAKSAKGLQSAWQWLSHHTAIRLLAHLDLSGPWGAFTGILKKGAKITAVGTAFGASAPLAITGYGALQAGNAINSAIGGTSGATPGSHGEPLATGGGAGGFGTVISPIYLDGREIARAIHNISQRQKRRGP